MVLQLCHLPCVKSCLLSQNLRDSDSLLYNNEACLALLSEAQSRETQHSGLLTDARPATTQSYIYIHKTEENAAICHTFCYCLETDQWKELEPEGTASMPDPPGSYIASYAEKVYFGIGVLSVYHPFKDTVCKIVHTRSTRSIC